MHGNEAIRSPPVPHAGFAGAFQEAIRPSVPAAISSVPPSGVMKRLVGGGRRHAWGLEDRKTARVPQGMSPCRRTA